MTDKKQKKMGITRPRPDGRVNYHEKCQKMYKVFVRS